MLGPVKVVKFVQQIYHFFVGGLELGVYVILSKIRKDLFNLASLSECRVSSFTIERDVDLPSSTVPRHV
jgi:hypothetical protein